MNATVFINYRREDSAPYAGRLYDRLTARFGEDQVFIDIDQIDPGEDFVEVINRKVSACDIAIVAIGPNWLRPIDASGKRRLDDEEDFVRMEIVAALERKIRVIPVLVGGARMPGRHDLPEALAPLSRRNAIELSETRFHADVNRLIEAIEKSFAVAEKNVEVSATPAAPPPEPATVRLPEPESKDLIEPSDFTKPAEPKEPKQIHADAMSGAAPVSLGETTEQFPTQAAQPYWESERGQQDSDATANDPTTPVKSTQATPATPSAPSTIMPVRVPHSIQEPIRPPSPSPLPSLEPQADAKSRSLGLPSKGAAAIACIPLIGGIIFYILEKHDRFVRFYAMQSIIFGSAWLLFNIVSTVVRAVFEAAPGVGGILMLLWAIIAAVVQLVFLMIMIITIVKAFTGVRWDIPYIGAVARRQVEAEPPPVSAAARPLEPESKDLIEPSDFTKPAEPKEPKEIHADAMSGAAPVSLGETKTQFPTRAAQPNWESERSQQDSVGTTNDPGQVMLIIGLVILLLVLAGLLVVAFSQS